MNVQVAIAVVGTALTHFPAGPPRNIRGTAEATTVWQQSRAAEWSLSSSPLVSIGGGSDPNEMLTRVVSVARLRDGRILLWEPRPASVRLFAASGRLIRIFAREGAGPGEIRDAVWIGIAADTILIHDRTQRRLTRFRSAGDVLSTVPFRVSDDGQAYSVIGRWQSGTFILRSLDAGFSGHRADGVRRDTAWLALADSGGSGLRRLVGFPGAATFTKATPNGGVYVNRQPFGADGLTAVGKDIVWVGDNATPTVVGYDRVGQPRRRVVVPFESTPVERRAADARRQHELGATRGAAVQALINAKYAALPKTNPYYSGLGVAPDGDLWVTGFAPYDQVGAEVAVLSPEGTVRATLRLPARFRVVQVDANVVTGVYRDDDDAEFVRVYAIRR